MNVERIGRDVQVFNEGVDGSQHVAMAFGERIRGAGTDPQCTRLLAFCSLQRRLRLGTC